MSRESLYRWFESVALSFSCLRKSQVKVLAAFRFGVAVARHCALPAVALSLACLGKPDTVERRLQRFLANLRVDWKRCCVALSAWVFRVFPKEGRIVLLVDETTLHHRLRAMVVSLAYRGRALPLAWWCYPNEAWPMGQVALIQPLLGWVAEGMRRGGVSPQRSVLVQADRAIGTSPNRIETIERQGWRYLFRVQRQTLLQLPDGEQIAFSALLPKRGRRAKVFVRAFKKAGWRSCWAIGLWRRKQEEPWLLLTNDGSLCGKEYAWRMWEEAAFRDLKSYGWHWESSRVWNPAHANRLWLAMALAYVWTISLGSHAIQNKEVRRELSRGQRWRYSVFPLGLRLLTRWLALARRLIFRLFLVPHYEGG